MKIRPVRLNDAHALIPLMTQLGYPSDERDIHKRLKRTENKEDYAAWVAEGTEKQLTGFVAGQIYYPYEANDPIVRLVALVVDENARRQNLGKLLVDVTIEWAVKNKAAHIALTSAYRRTEAYKFYENVGFTASGTRFGKDLR